MMSDGITKARRASEIAEVKDRLYKRLIQENDEFRVLHEQEELFLKEIEKYKSKLKCIQNNMQNIIDEEIKNGL